MNPGIKLYVHGTPDGQRLWGVAATDPDGSYIQSFYYNSKTDVSVLLRVEVKQFDSNAKCYYTYVRGGEICDHGGRGGSYFALTVRMDLYYADIRNMYNILDAAYEKYISGHILAATANGGAKYKVADFRQEENIIKGLDEELRHYLQKFSSTSDFIPLRGFAVNGRNNARMVNLYDCETDTVEKIMRTEGKVYVSPRYPSLSGQRKIQEKDAKIQEKDAEIARLEKQMHADRQTRDSEIQKAKAENDKRIQRVQEEERKKADLRGNELTQKLEEAERSRDDYKKKSDQQKETLDKICEAVLSYRNNKTELPEKDTCVGHPSRKKTLILNSILKMGRKLLSLFNFNSLLLVVLGVMIVMIVMIVPRSDKKEAEARSEENEQDMEAGEQTTPLDSSVLKNFNEICDIDVSGISLTDQLTTGKTYTVTLKMKNEKDTGGKWTSDNDSLIKIKGNKITPLHAGTFRISWEVGGKEIVSRELEVRQ